MRSLAFYNLHLLPRVVLTIIIYLEVLCIREEKSLKSCFNEIDIIDIIAILLYFFLNYSSPSKWSAKAAEAPRSSLQQVQQN